ncbi:membrane protein [Candidatus Thiomargarita nelsonii]|uniref:Membrane protein n=1 Tax=Candidatus Thiomargarita nelsonii TaxID=1003181 RepID=A0A4E0R0N8_9GAMM|nr:membrane protein [Candidatus Thiomargarita nelsonii]
MIRYLINRDIKNPKLIYLKVFLFLIILIISAIEIVLETKSWKIAILLLLVIWSSARIYYFMFYVIEKYLDSNYKFSGIMSFVRYSKGKLIIRDKTVRRTHPT